MHTRPSCLWSTKMNILRPTLSKSGSCSEILWDHWLSGIDLDKNWGDFKKLPIKFNISEDTLGKAHEQKSCQLLWPIYLKRKVNINGWLTVVLNSVWEQNRLEEISKIHSLGLSWSFHWKTVHGLKDKLVQRLLSTLTLKVWCHFTIKAHIKNTLRQHRKSSIDHHSHKIRILSVILKYFFKNTVSFSIKQGPNYLFYLS